MSMSKTSTIAATGGAHLRADVRAVFTASSAASSDHSDDLYRLKARRRSSSPTCRRSRITLTRSL